LSRFTATAWKCAKTSLRALTIIELAVASRQRTVSYLFGFSPGTFWPKSTWLSSPLTLLFSVFSAEGVAERPSFRHSWSDGGRNGAGVEHLHRTRLPCCI
jgi:hypothetical protein